MGPRVGRGSLLVNTNSFAIASLHDRASVCCALAGLRSTTPIASAT